MFRIILLSALCVSLSFQMQAQLHFLPAASLLDIFGTSIGIPLRNDLWTFDENCQVIMNQNASRAQQILFKFSRPSAVIVCAGLNNKHGCCDEFVPISSSTTTTSTTTTTESPPSKHCEPIESRMCMPEPACSWATTSNSNRTRFPRMRECLHQCWKHCWNPCACKTAADGNCEYHSSTGRCTERKHCNIIAPCRRTDAFYSNGGVLCRSKGIEENCIKGSTTIYAINISGGSTMDRRRIVYGEDNDEVVYQDDFNTKVDRENIDNVKDQDKFLYGTFVSGQANGNEKGQCLYYPMRVVETGLFEFSIRTMEPDYQDIRKRLFSVTLNGLPIVLHVDIRALSKGLGPIPVNIVVNFKLEAMADKPRRRLLVPGYDAINITNLIQLGLCMSECQLCKEYSQVDPGYILSGFSLVRIAERNRND